jgi:hypothetical protein
VSRLDPWFPVIGGKMHPDKLSKLRKPKLRKIALPVPTFGHSGHSAIRLTPNPVRHQKSRDQGGLQPDSPTFKNPQPCDEKITVPSSRLGASTRLRM